MKSERKRDWHTKQHSSVDLETNSIQTSANWSYLGEVSSLEYRHMEHWLIHESLLQVAIRMILQSTIKFLQHLRHFVVVHFIWEQTKSVKLFLSKVNELCRWSLLKKFHTEHTRIHTHTKVTNIKIFMITLFYYIYKHKMNEKWEKFNKKKESMKIIRNFNKGKMRD